MTDTTPPDDDDPKMVSGRARPVHMAAGKNRFAAREEDFRGANDEALAIRLSLIEEEHRDLDNAIRALEDKTPYERLSIARLKKKKLQLKDRIQELKDAMLPDIIA